MLRQICMDYNLGVPFRELTMNEIEFFYRPIYHGLLKKEED